MARDNEYFRLMGMEDEETTEYSLVTDHVVVLPNSIDPNDFLGLYSAIIADWVESIGLSIGGTAKIRKVEDG